jgi:hypothetical protein
MRRRLFTPLVGLSVALCVVVALLWCHSNSSLQVVSHRSAERSFAVCLYLGEVHFICADGPIGDPGWSWRAYSIPDTATRGSLYLQHGFERWEFGGFVRVTGEQGPYWEGATPLRELARWPLPYDAWIAPLWLLLLIFAAPFGRRLIKVWLRHVRRRRNGCAVCGYDLRATPSRCPECGAVPAAKQA